MKMYPNRLLHFIKMKFYCFEVEYQYKSYDRDGQYFCEIQYIIDLEDFFRKNTEMLFNSVFEENSEYRCYVFYLNGKNEKPRIHNVLTFMKNMQPEKYFRFIDSGYPLEPRTDSKRLLNSKVCFYGSEVSSPSDIQFRITNKIFKYVSNYKRESSVMESTRAIERVKRESKNKYSYVTPLKFHSPSTPVFISKKSTKELLDYLQSIRYIIKLNK